MGNIMVTSAITTREFHRIKMPSQRQTSAVYGAISYINASPLVLGISNRRANRVLFIRCPS
jgi:hypothetical protein